MSCVWQGQLASTPWPRHEPAVVDLPLELWATHGGWQLPAGEDMRLEFNKYVNLVDVPLWAIAGPELQVFTQDGECVEYFSELAAIQARSQSVRVAIRASLRLRGENAPLDHLLVYAVQEAGDPAARIAARPLLLSPPQLASPHTSPNPPASVNPEPAQVASGAVPPVEPRQSLHSASPRKQGIPDVKKAVQQTVLGALRLRGVRRDDPEFKNMYHIISRATEFALRQRTDVDVNDVHEKVEALLAIIE